MRGVLTLAGEGTRMLPWTRGLRKEFLPLYDRSQVGEPVLKPVAHLVLESLVAAGVDDATLVVGAKDLAFVQNYFSVDREFLERHAHHAERLEETRRFYGTLSGLRLRFAVQPAPRGFGDAVLQSEPFVGRSPFLLHAADAIVVERSRGTLPRAVAELRESEGLDAVLLVRRVADPRRYGVIEGRPQGRFAGLQKLSVSGLEEKPARPKTHWAATALYAFAPRVFDELRAVREARPNEELELTGAIDRMARDGGRVAALVLPPGRGDWLSVGSPEGYLRALLKTRRLVRPTTAGAQPRRKIARARD